MELKTATSPNPHHRILADLTAFAGGQPFLVVEVKAMSGAASVAAGWLVRLLVDLREIAGQDIPFGMVVDLDEILVFDVRKDNPAAPVCRFKTSEVLARFDPEFASKRIFDDYLLGLVERWLQSFGWRTSLTPPVGTDEFVKVGLADLLNDSSVYRKVHLADTDPVR